MALNTTGVYKPPDGSSYTRESGETSGAGQSQPEQCPQGQRFNAQTQKCEATDSQPYASQLAKPPPGGQATAPEQGDMQTHPGQQIYDPQPNPTYAQPPPTASDDVWNKYYDLQNQQQGQPELSDPYQEQLQDQGMRTEEWKQLQDQGMRTSEWAEQDQARYDQERTMQEQMQLGAPYAQQLGGQDDLVTGGLPPTMPAQLGDTQQMSGAGGCTNSDECRSQFGPLYMCWEGQCVPMTNDSCNPPCANGETCQNGQCIGGFPDDPPSGCDEAACAAQDAHCGDIGGGIIDCIPNGPDDPPPDLCAGKNCPKGCDPTTGLCITDGGGGDDDGELGGECGNVVCGPDQSCVGGECVDREGTDCYTPFGPLGCKLGGRLNAQTMLCCQNLGDGGPAGGTAFCPDGGEWRQTGMLFAEGYCAPKEDPWESGAPETWEEAEGEMPSVDDRWSDINRQRNIDIPGQVGDINFEDWMNVRGGGEGGYLDQLKAGGEAGVSGEFGDTLRGIAGQEGLGTEAEQEAVDAMSARIDQQYLQAEEELIKKLNEQAELGGAFNSGARMEVIGRELGDLQSEKLAMKNDAIAQMGLSGLEREITRQGQQIEASGVGAGTELQQQEQHRKTAETWGGFDIQEKNNMMNFMLGEYQTQVQDQLSRGELSVAEFNANVAENLGISEQQLQASGKDLEAAAMMFDYMLSKSSDERDWRNMEFGIDQFLMQMDFYRSQQLANLIAGIL